MPGRGCRRRMGGRRVQRRHAKVLGRRSLDPVQFRRDRQLAREVDGLGGVERVPRLLRQVQEHEGAHVRRFCQVINLDLDLEHRQFSYKFDALEWCFNDKPKPLFKWSAPK